MTGKKTIGLITALALSLMLFQVSVLAETAQDLLDSAGCTMIAKYNGTAQGFETHLNGSALFNFTIAAGEGYFVYCGANSTYSASGTSPGTVNSSMYTGWNLLGWISQTSNSTAQAVLNNIGATMMARYNATAQGFETHLNGSALFNFTVAATDGYFIYTSTNTTWSR